MSFIKSKLAKKIKIQNEVQKNLKESKIDFSSLETSLENMVVETQKWEEKTIFPDWYNNTQGLRDEAVILGLLESDIEPKKTEISQFFARLSTPHQVQLESIQKEVKLWDEKIQNIEQNLETLREETQILQSKTLLPNALKIFLGAAASVVLLYFVFNFVDEQFKVLEETTHWIFTGTLCGVAIFSHLLPKKDEEGGIRHIPLLLSLISSGLIGYYVYSQKGIFLGVLFGFYCVVAFWVLGALVSYYTHVVGEWVDYRRKINRKISTTTHEELIEIKRSKNNVEKSALMLLIILQKYEHQREEYLKILENDYFLALKFKKNKSSQVIDDLLKKTY